MTDKDKICKQIKEVCINEKGYVSWICVRGHIYSDMARLQPQKPLDNVPNYLSYIVSNKDQRMKMRTGKFLGKQLKLNNNYLSPKILEILAGKVNFAVFGKQDNMKFLTGNDIIDAYANHVGSGSCMTGSDSYKVGLYAMNPKQIQLMVLECGMNSARALLFKLDNGSFYMDRIYSDGRVLHDQMIDYAIKKGWYYRNPNSCRPTFNSDCLSDTSEIQVSGLNWEDGKVPYMDTFSCGSLPDGSDGLLDISYEKGDIDLTHCGGYINGGGIVCIDCDNYIPPDDIYYYVDDPICGDCRRTNYFFCESCDNLHHNIRTREIVDLNIYVCSDCANESYVLCEDCEQYVEGYEHIENLERYVCNECFENYMRCEDCEGDFEDTVELQGIDKVLCDDCSEAYTQCLDCDDYFDNDDINEHQRCESCMEDCNIERNV